MVNKWRMKLTVMGWKNHLCVQTLQQISYKKTNGNEIAEGIYPIGCTGVFSYIRGRIKNS